MSDAVIISLIAAIGSIASAAIAAYAVIQVGRARGSIKETHLLINSRMTELLRVAGEAARAEGIAAGEQAQRDRAAERQP